MPKNKPHVRKKDGGTGAKSSATSQQQHQPHPQHKASATKTTSKLQNEILGSSTSSSSTTATSNTNINMTYAITSTNFTGTTSSNTKPSSKQHHKPASKSTTEPVSQLPLVTTATFTTTSTTTAETSKTKTTATEATTMATNDNNLEQPSIFIQNYDEINNNNNGDNNNHNVHESSPIFSDSDDENMKQTLNRYSFNNKLNPLTNNDDDSDVNYYSDDNDIINDDDQRLHSDNGSDCGFRDYSADLADLVKVNDVESLQEGLDNLGTKKFAKFSISSDGRGLSPLTLGAELNRLEIVKMMLDALKDYGGDELVDDDDNDGDNGDVKKLGLENETNSKSINPIDTPNLIGGWTALHCACSNDHLEMVDLLLNFNADPNAKDQDGMIALHFAADRGSVPVVETLLRHGSAVNELTTVERYSPLYLASQMGHIDVVSLLLASGSDIEMRDRDGWSALHVACDKNRNQCVNILLEYTDTICGDNDNFNNIVNENKNLVDNVNEKVKESSEKNFTDRVVNAKANDGVTPLYLASQHGYADVISSLINHNADPNIRENDGFGPLHVACQAGHIEAVSILLTTLTCDVNASALTDTEWKPLHFAAQENHHRIIELLIKHGANVDATTAGGHTPLHIAAECGRIESVKVLLEMGQCDAMSVDEEGWSPLHHASQNGSADVVEAILRHHLRDESEGGIGINDNNGCSGDGNNSDGCSTKLDDNSNNITDPNALTSKSTSSLTPTSSASNSTKRMTNQLDNYFKKSITTTKLMHQRTKDREDALLIAVINGHLNVVQTLLKYGARLGKSNKIYSPSNVRGENVENLETLETFETIKNEKGGENENQTTVLHAACQAGNVKMVKFLIENGVELNNRDEQGWTPLHFLAENDAIDCLEIILEAVKKPRDSHKNDDVKNGVKTPPITGTTATMMKSELNDSMVDDEFSPSPIFVAPFTSMPFHDDESKTKTPSSLTSQTSTNTGSQEYGSFDLNAQTDEGYSPVFIAAHNKSENILKRLLKLGARTDLVNHLGWSALHAASEIGWTEGVQLLLASNNVDVNRKTYHGFTALYLATQENRYDTISHLLTVVLADPNIAENQGFCPLHVAAQKGLVSCVELLLSNGALGNKTDSNGWTALHLAVQDGHVKTVETLIEHGVDVDVQTAEGVTSLMMAVIKTNVQVVDLLLQHGARTDLYDMTTGQAVLHVASKLAHPEIVEKLLAAGADVEAETKFDRMRPLHIAVSMPMDEEAVAEPVVRALLNEGAATGPAINCGGISPLHLAAQKGWNLIAKQLIEHGASIDLADDAGWTPLMFASRYGRVDMAKLLLASGAKPDVKPEKGRERVCALLLAVQNGYIDVVEALILWSCDVNATTDDGTTALYCASQCGDLDMVQMLLFNGADPNIRDRKGFVPLHPACLNGHRRVAESLLKAGCEVDQQARDGTRPVQLADRNGHEEIVEWLVKQEGAKVPNYEERFGVGNVFGQWGSYLKNVVAKVYKHGLEEYARLSGEDSSLGNSRVRNKNASTVNRHATVEKVNFSSAGSKQSINRKRMGAINESARRVYKV